MGTGERQRSAALAFRESCDGAARPDSDVDIAIALVPASEGTDWALGSYFALHNNWKQELETIVGRHVSLEAIIEGTPKIRRCAPLGALVDARRGRGMKR
jgi:hypothetical protein